MLIKEKASFRRPLFKVVSFTCLGCLFISCSQGVSRFDDAFLANSLGGLEAPLALRQGGQQGGQRAEVPAVTGTPIVAEPQVAVEPQVVEPQIAVEPQVAEPQVAEPQIAATQVPEPQVSPTLVSETPSPELVKVPVPKKRENAALKPKRLLFLLKLILCRKMATLPPAPPLNLKRRATALFAGRYKGASLANLARALTAPPMTELIFPPLKALRSRQQNREWLFMPVRNCRNLAIWS